MTTSASLPDNPTRRAIGPDLIAVAVLLAGTLFIYLRTGQYGFVNYDDGPYVFQNPHVTGGLTVAALRWAMTAAIVDNWHPLSELVHILVASLFGARPGPFHVTNAVLHAANVGLLFLFLRRATGRFWPAVLATALWAWHPLRVESVAWISELKDVLCGTFTLLTLIAYVDFARRRTAGRYAAVAVLLALALLAKPMAVTVPVVLLLLDVWPLGIAPTTPAWWRARVLEKLPLAALAIADGAFAIVHQGGFRAGATLLRFGIGARMANAAASVYVYLRQSVRPTHLALFYPHPAMLGRAVPAGPAIAGVLLLIALSAVALAGARRRPAVAVGWLWFLAMLVPVLGLLQVGDQAHADRFTYLPSIGLTVAIVWAAAALRPTAARTAGVVGVGLAVALLAGSVRAVAHWRDSLTLFAWSDAAVSDNYVAEYILADTMRNAGRPRDGLPLAQRSAALVGDRHSMAHDVLGLCLLDLAPDDDHVMPAMLELRQAATINPRDAGAWAGMARVMVRQSDAYAAHHDAANAERRTRDAIAAFQRSLKLDPDNRETAARLAYVYAGHGQMPQAMGVWQELIAKYPTYAPAHGDLADALRVTGDTAAAVDHYRVALAGPEAIRRPDWEASYAYLVSTSANATAADVQAVLPLASDACQQTGGREIGPLEAKAAAHARLGQVTAAIDAETQALRLAEASGRPEQVEQITHRLTLYRGGRPFVVEPPRPTTGPTSGPTTEPG